MRPRLSLVMIVKDEEAGLGRALGSVHGVVDEMVVVDTGSTDRSREIALSFGAKLFEHEWKDDFSEARNAALSKATGDWVLQLDGDEELVPPDPGNLESLLSSSEVDGYLCRVIVAPGIQDLDGERAYETFQAMRLFRRTEGMRYVYAIHENPLVSESRAQSCELAVVHFGPFIDPAKDRHGRNLRLLAKALSEEPDTPYLHFKMGRQLMLGREWAAAYSSFATAIDLEMDMSAPYVPSMVRDMASCQYELGDWEGARETLEDGLRYFPDYTDLVFIQALVAAKEQKTAEASRLLRRCLQMGDPPPERYWSLGGTGSWRARAGLEAQERLASGTGGTSGTDGTSGTSGS